MDIVYLTVALVMPALAGTLFVHWLLGADGAVTFPEACFLGWGLGTGFLSYEIFVLGIAGLPFSAGAFTVPMAAFIALFAFLVRRRPARKRAVTFDAHVKDARFYIALFLGLWVFIKVCFVFYESFNRPVFTWDSFRNWAVAAKFFFYRKGLALDPSDEHFFGRGYRFFLGHPLHLPLLQTWIALWLGRFHEVFAKAPNFFYFLGVLGLLYYAVKREAGTFIGLLTLFFMTSVPLFTYHGQASYSDLPLGYFSLASVVSFWKFINTEDRRFILLSGLFTGMAVFVKNEGLLFLVALFIPLVFYLIAQGRRKPVALAAFLAPVALLAGPWLLFKAAHGFGFGHTGAASGFKWLSDPTFAEDARKGIHWEVLYAGLKEVFFRANFNLIFPFWVIFSVTGFRKITGTELKYLYMVLLLVMAMFIFIYLTVEVTAVTEVTGINRNILTFLPILFFTSALLAARLWRTGPSTADLPGDK